VWHELRRRNVWLRTVEDDEEMRDEASVAAIGRRAHIDSKRKSKSVKKGMTRRARDRGKLSGGPRALGFRWEGPHLRSGSSTCPRRFRWSSGSSGTTSPG
jgi:hypothetical protein